MGKKKRDEGSLTLDGFEPMDLCLDSEENGQDLDPVDLYMNDIAGIEAMDAETERKLAREVQAGIRAGKMLEEGREPDAGQRACLYAEIEKGERARTRLIESQLRMVVNVAKMLSDGRAPLADMIQEGNIGLLQAINRFDPDKGFRLSTYAGKYVVYQIKHFIRSESNGVIHIPMGVLSAKERVLKYADQYRMMNKGESPSEQETAYSVRLPIRTVRLLETIPSFQKSIFEGPASIRSVDPDLKLHYIDIVARKRGDEEVPEPFELIERSDLREQLHRSLGGLPLDHSVVLRLRYGLEDGVPRTLEEVGRELRGVSRQRIFRIEKAAMEKLRRSDSLLLQRWSDYLE